MVSGGQCVVSEFSMMVSEWSVFHWSVGGQSGGGLNSLSAHPLVIICL